MGVVRATITGAAIALCVASLVGSGPALAIRPAIITLPTWRDTPREAVAEAARAHGVHSGAWMVTCEATASGWVTRCEAVEHQLSGGADGDPALNTRLGHAARQGRMVPSTYDGRPLWSQVMFTVSVAASNDGTVVDIGEPICVQCINRDGDRDVEQAPIRGQGRFPAEALRARIAQGSVLLRCHADGAGSLSECSIWDESPVGAGFGREALAAADDGLLRVAGGSPRSVAFLVGFHRPA